LEIVSRVADANELLDALPTSFSTPELNVACAEGEAPERVREAVALADFGPAATVNTIDGLRIDWPDGFGLMRSSNTTPVLVLRFEGHTEAALERIQTAMLALLHRVKPDAQIGASAH
jgi:phosphomannomutase